MPRRFVHQPICSVSTPVPTPRRSGSSDRYLRVDHEDNREVIDSSVVEGSSPSVGAVSMGHTNRRESSVHPTHKSARLARGGACDVVVPLLPVLQRDRC